MMICAERTSPYSLNSSTKLSSVVSYGRGGGEGNRRDGRGTHSHVRPVDGVDRREAQKGGRGRDGRPAPGPAAGQADGQGEPERGGPEGRRDAQGVRVDGALGCEPPE